ncbi:hypothetical protein HNR46_000347 [Haloferula luteola]|uniref:EcsC protein family protein n=1 Tax=Haloferula luteola TaxID=595692 RepID=A0A840UZ73_9BACT|nr:hypothetical protein [Haloferula luteola]MBB5350126.1 hypothetical protein [Haloferula luteola]
MSESPPDKTAHAVTQAILGFLGQVPESQRELAASPADAARAIANAAASRAATTAGVLALPPGPLAWATILPEIIAVWKIQAQMVSDIAAVFGKRAQLSQEQMLYCLFRHTAAQAVRDLVVRVGERYLIKKASYKTLESAARKVGLKITQRAVGKGISRLIPLLSAVGVGGYAWYDTARVAKTAIDLFQSPIDHELPAPEPPVSLPN